MKYDSLIVGSGPAGVSAAINLYLLGKSFVWYGGDITSSKAARAENIKNYPGIPDVTGKELMEKFALHAKKYYLETKDEQVTGIYGEDGDFIAITKNEQIECSSVILCTGADSLKTAKGEDEFLGRGISYCATCDGLLYKGKTIGIYLDEKKYEEEARYLISLASKVYLFPLFKGCTLEGDNVEIVMKKPKEFKGDIRLEKVVLDDREIELSGMFILKSALPATSLVKGLEIKDGHIVTDKRMATNLDGIFAAGDCTGRPYQYAKAVGEGNIAAHSAADYLG